MVTPTVHKYKTRVSHLQVNMYATDIITLPLQIFLYNYPGNVLAIY